MKNWEKKELARELRKQGLSYKEIRQQIPVSKSSISYWCRDIELTPEQKARLSARYDTQLRGSKTNQERRATEIKKIKEQAKTEISSLPEDALKIAGSMLYWAEGDKSQKHIVGFSNSDPEMIRFMMQWFREVCQVPEDRFRLRLHLHSGQDESQMKRFWSEITSVPLSQFSKSFVKPEGTGHRKNRLYNGTAAIRICDSNLFWRIQGWIEGFKNNIINKAEGR